MPKYTAHPRFLLTLGQGPGDEVGLLGPSLLFAPLVESLAHHHTPPVLQ